MAERSSSQARQQRSAAREQRRSLAAEPFEALDETTRAGEQDEGQTRAARTLKQAAITAAAGAVAAGLAGAGKALLDRRRETEAAKPNAEDREPDPESTDREPEPEAAAETPEPEAAEPEAGDGGDAGPETGDAEGSAPETDEPEGEDEEPRAEATEDETAEQDEPEPRDEALQDQAEPEDEPPADQAEPEDDGNPRREARDDDRSERQQKGASEDDAKAVIDQARRELEELLGAEPERVSGFERRDGRWTVTVEVVDLRRVPDSTDVLASYELTFDDDRNLVSVTQKRRYFRSQVEDT